METESPVEELDAMLRSVHSFEPDGDSSELLAVVSSLTHLENAITAAISRTTSTYRAQELALDEQRDVPERDRGRHIPTELALAGRISRSSAQREAASDARLESLPLTMEAWRAGLISETAARAVSSGARHLDDAGVAELDRQIAPILPKVLAGSVAHRVQALVDQIDADGAIERHYAAKSERRVTLRAAENAMGYLTVYGPHIDLVAIMSALTKAYHLAARDPKAFVPGKAAFLADELFRRTTCLERPEQIPFTVNVVMSADSLTGDSDQPATTDDGESSIAADLIRRYLSESEAPVTLRRFLTDPNGQFMTATERKGRFFTGQLRDFITIRDKTCRGPNCNAPIRHVDHAVRHSDGGATTAENGDGLCEACNLGKERMTVQKIPPQHDGGPPGFRWTTPNGRTYDSYPPAPLPPKSKPLPKVHIDLNWLTG